MTKEQSELFDFSMDLGFTRETREGIERAARNANEVWTNYAKHAFVFMAVGRMFFTSADVDVYMMEHFPQIKTHEKRAMGQVTLWAMKNKVVRANGSIHARPTAKLPSKTLPGVGIFVKKMIFKPAVFLWQETTYYLIVVFVGGWYILKDWITGDPEISGEYYGPDPERKKK